MNMMPLVVCFVAFLSQLSAQSRWFTQRQQSKVSENAGFRERLAFPIHPFAMGSRPPRPPNNPVTCGSASSAGVG